MRYHQLFAVIVLNAVACSGAGGAGAPGAGSSGSEIVGTRASAPPSREGQTGPGASRPGVLVAGGQQAVLDYTIDVVGKVTSSNQNGEYSNWSTIRRLVIRRTLTALKPTAQDPGEPRGPHSGARPDNAAAKPPAVMAALAAELQKCGTDPSCLMQVREKAMQHPQFQADLEKMKSDSEATKRSPARYQTWFVERRVPSEGSVTLEDRTDEMLKTGTKEYKTCRKFGEAPIGEATGGGGWPASFRFDNETGTYAANIAIMAFRIKATTDCVDRDERGRTEEHASSGEPFLPDAIAHGPLAELENFRGTTDLAAGGRQLAHGEKNLEGRYGSVLDDKPMAAKITIRWTLTLKD